MGDVGSFRKILGTKLYLPKLSGVGKENTFGWRSWWEQGSKFDTFNNNYLKKYFWKILLQNYILFIGGAGGSRAGVGGSCDGSGAAAACGAPLYIWI